MSTSDCTYDPRYLAGLWFFNARDFFAAHEVWEDLWHASVAPERRFYQALIQAAVALFHYGNRNGRGAARLFASSRDYMRPYRPAYLGLDVAAFWEQMEWCCAGLLAAPEAPPPLATEAIPTITLDPEPAAWPDAAAFLPEEGGHE